VGSRRTSHGGLAVKAFVRSFRRPRLRTFTGAIAVGVAMTIALPSVAYASVSSTPDKTAGLGGNVVYDVAKAAGDRMIVGGNFTSVGAFQRSNLGAILPTGKADPNFAPTTNGTVYAVATSADGSRVFIGGNFTQVNGVPRQNLAALDAVTGALVEDWQADTTGTRPDVLSLAVSGDRLYVGGRFAGIDGIGRSRIAAVDTTTGTALGFNAWNTWLNGAVLEVKVSSDGSTVWVGGEFTRIRGVDRLYTGAIDATTGVPTSFAPTGSGGRIITVALSPDNSWFYAASDNNTVFAYQHAVSDDPVWRTKMSGNVQAMAVSDSELYLGGHFSQFVEQRVARPFLGSADPFTGAATSWDTKCTGIKAGVWSLLIDGPYLHAGGEFTHFNGVQRRLYARFSGTP
jgi:hypothetical protein